MVHIFDKQKESFSGKQLALVYEVRLFNVASTVYFTPQPQAVLSLPGHL